MTRKTIRSLNPHVLLTITLSVSACSRAEARRTAQPPAPAPTVAATAGTSAQEPPPPPRSITARFKTEESSRDIGSPKVNEVFAALRTAGLSVTKEQQHLASPFEARYCVGASLGDVAISVCEFDDAERAARGRDVSERMLASIPNRRVVANRTATLTVREVARSADSERTAARAIETFARL